MKHSIHVTALVCFVASIAATASWARTSPPLELNASISRGEVVLDEPFELRLRIEGDPSSSPDLSPLERDFEVIGVNQASNTIITNGHLEQSREWVVRLVPLRAGRIEIPSLRIGGAASSAPLTVEVMATSSARQAAPTHSGFDPSNDSPVFVTVELDDAPHYVQGQIRMWVRIHSERPILSGSLGEPQIAGASVERIGDDRSYEATVDGRRVQVIEREFAIFPQRSGEFQIPSIVFEGRVPGDPSRRRGFGSFPHSRIPSSFGGSLFDQIEEMMGDGFFGPPGQEVRAHSRSLVLDVQPRPGDADERWWFPAEEVQLSESWSAEPEILEVGEELTRTFVVQAYGVSRDQIPEIETAAVEGIKQYHETGLGQTVQTDQGLASIKTQKTVIIPTQPGEYVLPAVELPWWSTADDRARVAKLPERRITVVPSHATKSDPSLATGPTASSGSGEPPRAAPTSEIPSSVGNPSAQSNSDAGHLELRRGALIATAVAIALALGFALFRRRNAKVGRATARPDCKTGVARVSPRSVERRLERACEANDTEAAVEAIRELAKALWPDAPAMSPGAFAARMGGASLRDAVADLQRTRFANRTEQDWNGVVLWSAYREARRESNQLDAADARVLPNLYPSSSTQPG